MGKTGFMLPPVSAPPWRSCSSPDSSWSLQPTLSCLVLHSPLCRCFVLSLVFSQLTGLMPSKSTKWVGLTQLIHIILTNTIALPELKLRKKKKIKNQVPLATLNNSILKYQRIKNLIYRANQLRYFSIQQNTIQGSISTGKNASTHTHFAVLHSNGPKSDLACRLSRGKEERDSTECGDVPSFPCSFMQDSGDASCISYAQFPVQAQPRTRALVFPDGPSHLPSKPVCGDAARLDRSHLRILTFIPLFCIIKVNKQSTPEG